MTWRPKAAMTMDYLPSERPLTKEDIEAQEAKVRNLRLNPRYMQGQLPDNTAVVPFREPIKNTTNSYTKSNVYDNNSLILLAQKLIGNYYFGSKVLNVTYQPRCKTVWVVTERATYEVPVERLYKDLMSNHRYSSNTVAIRPTGTWEIR